MRRALRPCLLLGGLSLLSATALAQDRTFLSHFGTPGLIDMPTADTLPDGELGLTATRSGATQRNTLTFQITPRLSGSFRYAIIDDFDPTRDRFDRSFDLSYRLSDEGRIVPALTLGLRDFGGTGIYSGEYLAATKGIGPFRMTAGLGWGRLGQRNSFDNPLGALSGHFETRPLAAKGGIDTTGQVDFDNWFRGDTALFGGLEWRPADRTRVVVEYSSDEYRLESDRGLVEQDSPFNFGVNHRFRNGIELGLAYLYGDELGLSLSYVIDPRSPPGRAGIEDAPRPIRPRDLAAASSPTAASEAAFPRRLGTALADEGLSLEGLVLDGRTATLFLGNPTYQAGAQAIGRAARALANAAPPGVESFRIVPVVAGQPLSAVTLARGDLEALEFELDGSWQSYARADIDDAFGLRGQDPGQAFEVDLGAYISPSIFDPDDPVRADFGAELTASWSPAPPFVLSGSLRQPLLGNLDDAGRRSESELPRVRSDFALYDAASDMELTHLTAEAFARPGRDLYGRLTLGYLERMYAGLSTELLWKPVQGPLALGIEVNYAVQRGYEVDFSLRDYDVVTGHASAYYDWGQYQTQVDVGRYLAGDWGATFSLDRRFANGFLVGAFFTLTDVPFEEFGEGSFDKGIRFEVPVSWLSGQPSREGFAATIRPVTRDGGARLDVRNRLYDVVSDYHDPELRASWGRFWR